MTYFVTTIHNMHSLSMATPTKPNIYRVYLNAGDVELMKKICEVTELGQSELLSKLMVSAIRSVADNNCRFPLPLKFAVMDGITEDNTRLPKTALIPKDRK